jgi:hypothetical protein
MTITNAEHERRPVAVLRPHLVRPEAGDRDNAVSEADLPPPGEEVRERTEIASDEIPTRGEVIGIRRTPPFGFEQLRRNLVDVVAPQRKEARVAPVTHVRRDVITRLENERNHPAGQEMCSGGQADWTGSNHDGGEILVRHRIHPSSSVTVRGACR